MCACVCACVYVLVDVRQCACLCVSVGGVVCEGAGGGRAEVDRKRPWDHASRLKAGGSQETESRMAGL